MRKKVVLKAYGGAAAVARRLDISDAAVSQWGEIIPPLAAHELAKDGKLPFDPSLYAHASTRTQQIVAVLSQAS